MAISRPERRAERKAAVEAIFGNASDTALDLIELVELAWHDCYKEVTPPDKVVEDILICSRGNLSELIAAARLAVEDFRDLRLQADDIRNA